MMTWVNRRRSRVLLIGLLLLIGGGWLINAQREQARRITYVIPPGTLDRIEAGQAGVELPDEIRLTLGVQDTIIIENQDDVVHTFGPFVIGPHATLTKRFETATTYEGACTFHEARQMRLVVQAAPWDILN